MEIGKIIKEKRSAKSMTQEELANEFFVSRQLISKWENGKSYPDLEQLIKLSGFFDLTLDELMRGDKKMTRKLNTIIKRRSFFIAIIIILLIAIVGIGYYSWSNKVTELKPSDIEITSIKVEHSPSIEKINVDTKELVVMPADVTYTIKYKIKKPFTNVATGYYFGQDEKKLYVDMRGQNTLFPAEKEETFIIASDSERYGKEESLDVDENYIPRVINDKDIDIINVYSFDGMFANVKSVKWIDKSELEN